MSSSDLIKRIREDLKDLSRFWVVLYGSHASGNATSRSDIDIAVITQLKDRKANVQVFQSILKYNHPPYDLKLFELMPLYMKIRVIEHYVVIFGDELDISEYFYFWRKLWKDVEPRYERNQFKSLAELERGIKRRNEYIKCKKKQSRYS